MRLEAEFSIEDFLKGFKLEDGVNSTFFESKDELQGDYKSGLKSLLKCFSEDENNISDKLLIKKIQDIISLKIVEKQYEAAFGTLKERIEDRIKVSKEGVLDTCGEVSDIGALETFAKG